MSEHNVHNINVLLFYIQIVMCYTSPLNPVDTFETKFIQIHGDAVRDVAMRVDDAKKIYQGLLL